MTVFLRIIKYKKYNIRLSNDERQRAESPRRDGDEAKTTVSAMLLCRLETEFRPTALTALTNYTEVETPTAGMSRRCTFHIHCTRSVQNRVWQNTCGI